MKDIGLYSFSEKAKFHLISLLCNYCSRDYIVSTKKNLPFKLLKTPLSNKIEQDSEYNDPGTKSLNGFLAIQKPRSWEKIHIFIANTPRDDLYLKRNYLHDSNSDGFQYGNYAKYCSNQIILFRCDKPPKKQFNKILFNNFNHNSYSIILTNFNHFLHGEKQAKIEKIKNEFRELFHQNSLNLNNKILTIENIKINKKLNISEKNSKKLQQFFEIIDEKVTITHNPKTEKEIIFKITSLSAQTRVGASSFFHLNCEEQKDEMRASLKPTIFMDIHIMRKSTQGLNFTFEIFDVSGEERWKFLLQNFLSISEIIFLFYNLQEPTSLEKLRFWFEYLIDKYPDKPIILIGTHKDKFKDLEEKDCEWLKNYSQLMGHFHHSIYDISNNSEIFELVTNYLMKKHYISPSSSFNSQNIIYQYDIEKYPLLEEIYQLSLRYSNYLDNSEIQRFFLQYDFSKLLQSFYEYFQLEIPFYQYLIFNLLKTWNKHGFNPINSFICEIEDDMKNKKTLFLILQLVYDFIKSQSKSKDNEDDINGIKLFESELSQLILRILIKTNKSLEKERNFAIEIILLDIIEILHLKEPCVEKYLLNRIVELNNEIREESFCLYRKLYTKPKEYGNHFTIEVLINNLNDRSVNYVIKALKTQIKSHSDKIVKNAIHYLGYIDKNEIRYFLLSRLILLPVHFHKYLIKSILMQRNSQLNMGKLKDLFEILERKERNYILKIIKTPKGLFSPNHENRNCSIEVLNVLSKKKYNSLIYILLNDSEEKIRIKAVNTLIETGEGSSLLPLSLSYITSESIILKDLILNTLKKILNLPEKEKISELDDIIEIIPKKLKNQIENEIIKKIDKSISTPKQTKYIKSLKIFKSETSISKLITIIDNLQPNIVKVAKETLRETFENMEYTEFSNSMFLNMFFDFGFKEISYIFSYFNLEEYFVQLSWRSVIQGLLYKRIEINSYLKDFLRRWPTINTDLLYELSEIDFLDVFKKFINELSTSEIIENTYFGFLISTYPHSYNELGKFITKNRSSLRANQIQKINGLEKRLSKYFTANIQKSNNEEESGSFSILL